MKFTLKDLTLKRRLFFKVCKVCKFEYLDHDRNYRKHRRISRSPSLATQISENMFLETNQNTSQVELEKGSLHVHFLIY